MQSCFLRLTTVILLLTEINNGVELGARLRQDDVFILLSLGVFAFLSSLILTPVIRDWFLRFGIVDHPDANRKIHTSPVPRVGGLAILLSYLIAYPATAFGFLSVSSLIPQDMRLAAGMGAAVLIVFLTGFLDDVFGLKPWQKLLAQVAASGIAYWGGVQIHFRGQALDAWLAIPLSITWLVACTNAFNLIDGMDGLAAGVGLFATITTLMAALAHHDIGLVMATVPLAGCLLGFLRYNFNPASIFLGDSGSLTIGFFLGCCGAIWSQKAATLLGMTAPLMAFAIPLLDASLAVLRRFLRNQPIFGADRRHIHHLLLDRGMTPRRVALLVYGTCTVAAICSLLQTGDQFGGLVIVLFCIAAWVGVQNLGYSEFGLARRLLFGGTFRQIIDVQFRLKRFEQALSSAVTAEQSWSVLQTGFEEFGFAGGRAVMEGQIFESAFGREEPKEGFQLRIPLSESEYVNLRREFNKPLESGVVAGFAEVVYRVLSARLRRRSIERETSQAGAAIGPEWNRRPVAVAAGTARQ
ncbi:MAG: hypothetical protein C5B51_06440 [Terriglobia bacterium]|nr:MAG: hypothetical protein C5B51_06440 [Terriglobia bacterium]